MQLTYWLVIRVPIQNSFRFLSNQCFCQISVIVNPACPLLEDFEWFTLSVYKFLCFPRGISTFKAKVDICTRFAPCLSRCLYCWEPVSPTEAAPRTGTRNLFMDADCWFLGFQTKSASQLLYRKNWNSWFFRRTPRHDCKGCCLRKTQTLNNRTANAAAKWGPKYFKADLKSS